MRRNKGKNGKYHYCTASQTFVPVRGSADPAEMWEAGASLHRIAAAMGCTCGEISDTLINAGFYLRTRIDEEYIVELAKTGASYKEMATEFGVTFQRISRYLRDNLPEIYKPKKRTSRMTKVESETYLRLVKSGAGITSIALTFGVTTDVVWAWLEKFPDMPLPKFKLDIDRGRIKALYRAGRQWNPTAISFDVHLPERVVRQVLREMAEKGEIFLREEDRDG